MQKSQVVALLLAVGTVASAQTIIHQPVSTNTITHVATALNHITLIEFPDHGHTDGSTTRRSDDAGRR